MAIRRDALKMLGCGALALAQAVGLLAAAAKASAWPPYPQAMAIDCAGGTSLFWFEAGDRFARVM